MSDSAAKAFLILSAAALLVVVVFLYRPDYFSTQKGWVFSSVRQYSYRWLRTSARHFFPPLCFAF